MTDPLDLAELQEIVSIPDASAANARITMAYHRLSEDMRAALGTNVDLDWCGFAKWSSHTVGIEINRQATGTKIRVGRGGPSRLNIVASELTEIVLPKLLEDIPAIRDWAHGEIKAKLEQLAVVDDDLARRALRTGNVTIFNEMGRAYVALLARLAGTDTAGTDAQFAARVATDVVTDHGRALPAPLTRAHLEDAPATFLEQALLYYLRAAREPALRSEFVLAGNVAFSRFEQNRADRLIAIGLCAPARSLLISAVNAALTPPGKIPVLDQQTAMLEGAQHSNPVVRTIDHAVVRWLTAEVMFVELGPSPAPFEPGRRVRLGLPALIPVSAVPITQPDVQALFDTLNKEAQGVATDWLQLPYRMSVIMRYFAAFQLDPGPRVAPPGLE